MAVNLGLQIVEWVNRLARRLAAKPDASGIMTIPNRQVVIDTTNEILTKFKKHGVPNDMIRSENDVKVIYNQWKNKIWGLWEEANNCYMNMEAV